MKYVVFFILFFAFVLESNATHLMGGEITAKQMHDSTYQITLTTYRDTLGIPMDSVANFIVKDTAGNTVMTFSIPYDTAISGNILNLYPYGVEVYIFKDTIHLPGPGTYHISFTDCCRNGAIQNLSAPLNENMYLTTTVTHFSNSSNSTPFFLVQPVIFLPVNTTWSYNPLPFDVNGDSLVWVLDTPLTAFNTYCAGYSTPPSATSGPFSLNSANGSINWTASQIGNFDATVLVEEYRNNVKIGEIRRDMQFIVVQPTSSMAFMSNMSNLPKDNLGNFHVEINANERYMFSFFAEDKDSSDVVSIQAFGEPFLFDQLTRASFFVSKTGKTYGNEVEGTLVWKPKSSLVRQKPYIIVYRVSDGIYVNDYTVMYTVKGDGQGQPTGISEHDSNASFTLFPNPSNGNSLIVEVNTQVKGNIQMEIYNLSGRLISTTRHRPASIGDQLRIGDLNLQSGSYLLIVKNGGQLTEQLPFVVIQ
ncbi:MAG: T9SS type A sorting domain-containing protein [Vicingaceae bacterium]